MVHCLRTKNIKTTKQGHEDAIKNLKLLDKMEGRTTSSKFIIF